VRGSFAAAAFTRRKALFSLPPGGNALRLQLNKQRVMPVESCGDYRRQSLTGVVAN